MQRAPIGPGTPPEFQRKIAAFDEPAAEHTAPIAVAISDIQTLSVDEGLAIDKEPAVGDELEAWKKSRKFTIPWRQLSLMASLSFGIASFVLPASVNRNVDYVLYALAGMSLYVGISKRLEI